MHIGVPAETRANEARVAATPETVKKYASAGHHVSVAKGAGTAASYPDDAYAAAGAELTEQSAAFAADIVLKVQAPTDAEMASLKRGSVLIGMLEPFNTEQA
ncbi:NAD(P)(+) transhydrogenase (Re/Si-specific) subunit alpha, partial [Burkholderia sp. Bp8963]